MGVRSILPVTPPHASAAQRNMTKSSSGAINSRNVIQKKHQPIPTYEVVRQKQTLLNNQGDSGSNTLGNGSNIEKNFLKQDDDLSDAETWPKIDAAAGSKGTGSKLDEYPMTEKTNEQRIGLQNVIHDVSNGQKDAQIVEEDDETPKM